MFVCAVNTNVRDLIANSKYCALVTGNNVSRRSSKSNKIHNHAGTVSNGLVCVQKMCEDTGDAREREAGGWLHKMLALYYNEDQFNIQTIWQILNSGNTFMNRVQVKFLLILCTMLTLKVKYNTFYCAL